jgi:biopolymer transport protein ExbB/TolQ
MIFPVRLVATESILTAVFVEIRLIIQVKPLHAVGSLAPWSQPDDLEILKASNWLFCISPVSWVGDEEVFREACGNTVGFAILLNGLSSNPFFLSILERRSGGWCVALVQSRPAVGLVSLFLESTAILMHIRAELLGSFPSLPFLLGDASDVFNIVGQLSYVALAAVAVWGAYYVFLVLTRVNAKRFKTEAMQDEFIGTIEEDLRRGNFDAVIGKCEGSKKALPMMVTYLCKHRSFGFSKVRQMTLDRFQRDVIADLDYSIAWIVTVIKTAPMLGLFGTVVGMMGAFGKLASATNVNPTDLAGDIRVALETTAIGLTIAIPLVMAMAAIHNRIRHMQDLVGSGLAQVLEAFKVGAAREEQRGVRQSA